MDREKFRKLVESYNPNIDENTVFGLFPAKYIGDVSEEDDQKVLVELEYELQIYAQVTYSFPFLSIPSKEWVEKFDDPLFCYVGFEKGFLERPIITSFFFKQGSKSSLPNPDYPRSHFLYFENFTVEVNDVSKELTITNTESGHSVKLHNSVDLGKLEALEPAVLANTLDDTLSAALDDLGLVSGLATPAGPSGPLSSAPNWASTLAQIKASFADFKSPNVNLD